MKRERDDNDEAIGKTFVEADQKVFEKFFTDVLISSETQRFELNPHMSYESAEIRAGDPAFWMPKKKPVKKTAVEGETEGCRGRDRLR